MPRQPIHRLLSFVVVTTILFTTAICPSYAQDNDDSPDVYLPSVTAASPLAATDIQPPDPLPSGNTTKPALTYADAATPTETDPILEFQRTLQETLQRRAAAGLPVPTVVALDHSAAATAAVTGADAADGAVTVSGATVLDFATPAAAGLDAWPAFLLDRQLPAGADGALTTGDYTAEIQRKLADAIPGIWARYTPGQEPRRYTLEQTVSVVQPAETAAAAVDTDGMGGAVTTGQDILMGSTKTTQLQRWTFREKWEVCVWPFPCVALAEVNVEVSVNHTIGVRLPLAINLTAPPELTTGNTYQLQATARGLDWSADDFNRAGVGPSSYSGMEFVNGLDLRQIGYVDMFGSRVGDWEYSNPIFDRFSRSFTTPLGSGATFGLPTFVLPSSETHLQLFLPGDFSILRGGIGLILKPSVSNPVLTARWNVTGDAERIGPDTVTFAQPNAPVPLPLMADNKDNGLDTATITFSDFKYRLSEFRVQLGAFLEIILFGYGVQITDPWYFEDWRLPETTLDVHSGTPATFSRTIRVVSLELTKSVDRAFILPGEPVVFTTVVTNHTSADRLVTIEDTLPPCSFGNIGILGAHQSVTLHCTAAPGADLRSIATATGAAADVVHASDEAMVYVADGIAGSGSATSCNEDAFTWDLYRSYGGGPVPLSFNCGGSAIIAVTAPNAISRPTVIDGADGEGGRVTLSGGGRTRLFDVAQGASLTLRNLVLADGSAHRAGSVGDFEGGGAIRNRGDVILEDCLLQGNSADYGGAIHTKGAVTIATSELIGNRAEWKLDEQQGGDGGAIYNEGVLHVSSSRIIANHAAGGGGGIANWLQGEVAIAGTEFSDNQAANGGAIESGVGGHIIVERSQFSGNFAELHGGAIANFDASRIDVTDATQFVANSSGAVGGAIYNVEQGTLMIAGAILANNSTRILGGAIYNGDTASVRIEQQSALTGNVARGDTEEAITAGGAIANEGSGYVVISDSRLANNLAFVGGAIHNKGLLGIQVDVTNNNAPLPGRTTIAANSAYKDGGAIYNDGAVMIANTTLGGASSLDANSALGGGAILNWERGSVDIAATSFGYNSAANGGAIENGCDEGAAFCAQALVRDATFLGNTATLQGGAVWNLRTGRVTIADSSFEQNRVVLDSDPSYPTAGGAIRNSDSGAVTITSSRFVDNRSRYGGAIHNSALLGIQVDISAGNIVLPGLTMLAGNLSVKDGGGIYNDGALYIANTLLDGNLAEGGGALLNWGDGLANIQRTTLANNSAGVVSGLGGNGGAIENGASADLWVENSTLAYNRASYRGGAIANFDAGSIMVHNSTINLNTTDASGAGALQNLGSSAFIVRSSIIANSNGANCAGMVTSGNYNIDSDGTCGFGFSGDQSPVSPGLGSYADNGGLPSFVPLPGSPAVDAAGNLLCPAMDQRSQPRPRDGDGDGVAGCDVGAIEVQTPPTGKATISILVDAQPDSVRNFRFTGPKGEFRLDDPAVDDGDGVTNTKNLQLPPGSYTVQEEEPFNWYLTAITCSKPGRVVVNLSQQLVVVQALPGDRVECTFVNQQGGSIRANSYWDRNANGRRDRGDEPLAQVRTTVYNDQGSAIASGVTDSNGKAVFAALRPAQYVVCQTTTTGCVPTQPRTLDPHYGQACYHVVLDPAAVVNLTFGFADAPVAAGEAPPDAQDGIEILGFFPDMNDDALYTAEEQPADGDVIEEVSQFYIPFVGR